MTFLSILFAYSIVFLIIRKFALKNKHISKIIYIAFLLRIIFGLIHYFSINIPFIGSLPDSGNDEIYFLRTAIVLSEMSLINSSALALVGIVEYYPLIISFLFRIFTADQLLVAAFNTLFNLLIIIYASKITEILWNKKLAKNTAIILAFLPMQIVYSSIMLRESIFTFFLVYGVYYFILYLFQKRNIYLFSSVFILMFAGLFHGASILVILFILIITAFFARGNNMVITIIFISTFIIMIFGLEIGKNKIQSVYSDEKIHDQISQLNELSLSKNRMFSYADEISTGGLITSGPQRVFNFLIRPFPWEYQVGLLRIPNSIIILMTLYFILLYFKILFFKPKIKVIMSIILFIVILFSFGSYDLYQSDRHRSKVIPLIVAVLPILSSKRDIYESMHTSK